MRPRPATLALATAAATRTCGRRLARGLPPFAIVVLVGELGAGKTTLMQGLAVGWGVASVHEVTSPTYTLIHEYRRGSRSLYHLDLYRIDTAPQLATLGLEDIFVPPPPGDSKLVAIEWGERIEAQLPRPYLRLALAATTDDRRGLTATWVI